MKFVTNNKGTFEIVESGNVIFASKVGKEIVEYIRKNNGEYYVRSVEPWL